MTKSENAKILEIIRENSSPMTPQTTGHFSEGIGLEGAKAVLFDVYGTLFISGSGDIGVAQKTAKDAAMEKALSQMGVAFRPGTGKRGAELLLQEIKASHAQSNEKGIPYPEVEIKAIWSHLLNALVRENWTEKITWSEDRAACCCVYYECSVNPVWPMPGMQEMLASLKSRGVILGIVSNAQFYTPLIFEALLNQSVEELGFHDEYCAWSYKLLRSKPDPTIFDDVLKALKQDGITPGDVIYVGNDMLNDMLTAQMAGCRTILFAGDKRSLRMREDDARCTGIKPDGVMTGF